MSTRVIGARHAARGGEFARRGRGRGSWALLVVAAGVTGWAAGMARAELPSYQLVGQYAGPAGWHAFDVMPDGRVVFMTGSEISVADVRGGGPAVVVGRVGPGVVSGFGPSFVSVSPDGALVAIGDNNFGSGASVHVVSMSALDPGVVSGTTAFAVPNTEACWSGGVLYVSGFGGGPVVTRVDVSAGTTRTVITGIGDGNGGVAVRGGRLFVGVGFDAAGGATTGQVRAFELAGLEAGAAEFGSGVLVARALSGASLGFDAGGNMLVGGGDFFSGSNDFGAAAVIDGESVAAALAGGGIDPVGSQLRLSPAGAGAFYGVRFNGATGELLVAGGGTVYRYAVPGPGAAGVVGAGLMGLAAGRRRRHG